MFAGSSWSLLYARAFESFCRFEFSCPLELMILDRQVRIYLFVNSDRLKIRNFIFSPKMIKKPHDDLVCAMLRNLIDRSQEIQLLSEIHEFSICRFLFFKNGLYSEI